MNYLISRITRSHYRIERNGKVVNYYGGYKEAAQYLEGIIIPEDKVKGKDLLPNEQAGLEALINKLRQKNEKAKIRV